MKITLREGDSLTIEVPRGKISVAVRTSGLLVITDERPESYKAEKCFQTATFTQNGFQLGK